MAESFVLTLVDSFIRGGWSPAVDPSPSLAPSVSSSDSDSSDVEVSSPDANGT
jgi:hypothetical protein